MVSIRLKKIALMALVASMALSSSSLFSMMRHISLDDNSSSGASLFSGFSMSPGSGAINPWVAAGCGVVALAPWARIFSAQKLSSSEIKSIEKVLEPGTKKLFNWRFTKSSGFYFENAASVEVDRGGVKYLLEQDYFDGQEPLYDGERLLSKEFTNTKQFDPKKRWIQIKKLCSKQIEELNLYIQDLGKVATEFSDYDPRAKNGSNIHGNNYKRFISKAVNQESINLYQAGWTGQANIVNSTDLAAKPKRKGLAGSFVPWYGWGLRLLPPLAAAVTGNYFYGTTGAWFGAAYALVTGFAWGLQANSEKEDRALATQLCWECIKKRERLQVIQDIAEKADEIQSTNPQQGNSGNAVSVNFGNGASQRTTS